MTTPERLELKIDSLSETVNTLVNCLNNGHLAMMAYKLADTQNRLDSKSVCKLLNITRRHLERIKKDIPMTKDNNRLSCDVVDFLKYCNSKGLL